MKMNRVSFLSLSALAIFLITGCHPFSAPSAVQPPEDQTVARSQLPMNILKTPSLDEKERRDRDEVEKACNASNADIGEPLRNCLQRLGDSGNAAALDRLAYFYQEGRDGVAKDPAKAAELYQQAAELGDVRAQNEIAKRYAAGKSNPGFDSGVDKDDQKSIDWNLKSATQGYAPAEVSLGDQYSGGGNIPVDYVKAQQYYVSAAMKGNPLAMDRLADMAEKGRGQAIDLVAWYQWESLSSSFSTGISTETNQALIDEGKKNGISAAQIEQARQLSAPLLESIKANNTTYCAEFPFDNSTCEISADKTNS